MKQEENELTIEEIYSFLQDHTKIGETAESKLSGTTILVEKYITQQQEKNKKVLPAAIFLIILFVSLIIGGAYCTMRMFELKSEKELTDLLIRKNESGGISYRTQNGRPITYQELMNECDSLHREVVSTQKRLYSFASSAIQTEAISVDYQSWTCRPSEIWLDAKKIITDKNGNYIIHQTSNGHIITFEEVWEERDSLYSLVNYYKLRMSLAEKKYGIKVFDNNGRVEVKSERVDSALLLLPYYKDRIEKTKEGYWAVHTYSNK